MQPNGRRALIVVDYQNDFVTGSMGFAKALTLERPTVEDIVLFLVKGAKEQ